MRITSLTEENRRLMEQYPYVRPMRGHLKERTPKEMEEQTKEGFKRDSQ